MDFAWRLVSYSLTSLMLSLSRLMYIESFRFIGDNTVLGCFFFLRFYLIKKKRFYLIEKENEYQQQEGQREREKQIPEARTPGS